MEDENLENKYLPFLSIGHPSMFSLSLSSSSFPSLFLFISSLLSFSGSMLRKQKICDLDSAGRRVVHHENILQLQVSVADILTVHLGDGVGNLPPRSSFSIKSLASSDINLIATLAKYFTYCYCLLYNKNNNIQELLKDWKFV